MTRPTTHLNERDNRTEPTIQVHLESGTALADLDLHARHVRAQLMRQGASYTLRGLRSVFSAIASRVRRSVARRRTMQALAGLDARTLRDIGIDPRNVADSVNGHVVQDSHPVRKQAAFATSMDQLAQPLRRWDLSRRTAGDLARLPRETLNDLGYGRGDIDRTAETMSERKLASGVATRNETERSHEASVRKAA